MMGYDIKASLSAASTTATAANVGAGTTFNFSSPFASGDTYNQRADPYAPATATSSAAGGDAQSSSVQGGRTEGGSNSSAIIIGASILAAALVAVMLLRK